MVLFIFCSQLHFSRFIGAAAFKVNECHLVVVSLDQNDQEIKKNFVSPLVNSRHIPDWQFHL